MITIMKFFSRLIICFFCLILYSNLYAGNYTVKKGSTIKVSCTATPPSGGWITHAFFSFVNPEDQEYLGLSYTSSDLQATFYGLKPKSNIKIEVTYAYSFRGAYDNDIHVGHGSYYDYISVTGAPNATGVEIRESDPVNIHPGTSKTLHIDFKPSGSEGEAYWGFVSGFGTPFNFNLKVADNGKSAVITAKEHGTYAYLIVMVDNDQTKSDIVKINCSEDTDVETPSSLSLSPSEVTISTEESLSLSPLFTPSSSWAELKWSTANSSVVTVNETGVITGKSPGTTKIKAETIDGTVSAEATIIVYRKLENFSLPSFATVNLGFTYTIIPTIIPTGAVGDLEWGSSDTSVATISSTGVVTAKSEGKCTITANSKSLQRSESMTIMVTKPQSVIMDHRNLRQRIQAVKYLITRTIIKNK